MLSVSYILSLCYHSSSVRRVELLMKNFVVKRDYYNVGFISAMLVRNLIKRQSNGSPIKRNWT